MIVVHGNRRVIARPCGGVEHRIGRVRAGQVIAFALHLGDQRRHPICFLTAHRAAFARMGVQTCDGNSGGLDPELRAKPRRRDLYHATQMRGGQHIGDLIQRDMDCGRHHPQLVRGEHHHHIASARQRGKVFGVARIGKSGPVFQRLFVNGRGGQRTSGPAAHQVNTTRDRVDHPSGIGGVRLACNGTGGKVVAQHGQRVAARGKRVGRAIDDAMRDITGQVARITNPGKRHFA